MRRSLSVWYRARSYPQWHRIYSAAPVAEFQTLSWKIIQIYRIRIAIDYCSYEIWASHEGLDKHKTSRLTTVNWYERYETISWHLVHLNLNSSLGTASVAVQGSVVLLINVNRCSVQGTHHLRRNSSCCGQSMNSQYQSYIMYVQCTAA